VRHELLSTVVSMKRVLCIRRRRISRQPDPPLMFPIRTAINWALRAFIASWPASQLLAADTTTDLGLARIMRIVINPNHY
jgi:hypothetical protein